MLTKVSFSMINGAPINVLDYGARGDGMTDDTAAFIAALKATTGTVVVPYTGNDYLLSDSLYLADATYTATGLIGINGKPTLKWSGLGGTDNCLMVQSGATPVQWEIQNLILDFNYAGQDGLVIYAGQHVKVYNVDFYQSKRDSLRFECGAYQWFQASHFSGLFFQDAGATPIVLSISGANGAFINEVLWEDIEIRGASKQVGYCPAIFATSGATDPASKFSCHTWNRINIDAQYDTGDTYEPYTSAIHCDSGNCENWVFCGSTTIENTGTSSALNGYMLYQSGSGAFSNVTFGRNVQGANLWGQGTNAIGWVNEYTNGITTIPGTILSKNVLVDTADLNNGDSENIFTVKLGEVWLVTGNNQFNSAYNVMAVVAGQIGPGLQITNLVDGSNRQFIYGGASGSDAWCAIKVNAGGPISMRVTALRLQ